MGNHLRAIRSVTYRMVSAMGKKWMCGSADVRMGQQVKGVLKSADAMCGCVSKRRMCGWQLRTLPVI